MAKIIFMMGITHSGKTTLMEEAKRRFGTQIHLVEVGKILREKYPPGYFEGLGAPQKTEGEALELLRQGVEAGKAAGAEIILVDGQPRRDSQISECLRITHGMEHQYLILDISDDIRETRIAKRFPHPEQEAARQLARDRTINDRVQLYDVLIGLHARSEGSKISVFSNRSNLDLERFLSLLDVELSETHV